MPGLLLPKNQKGKTGGHRELLPNSDTFPKSKKKYLFKQAVTDLIIFFTDPHSTTAPRLQAGGPIRNKLPQLATLF